MIWIKQLTKLPCIVGKLALGIAISFKVIKKKPHDLIHRSTMMRFKFLKFKTKVLQLTSAFWGKALDADIWVYVNMPRGFNQDAVGLLAVTSAGNANGCFLDITSFCFWHVLSRALPLSRYRSLQ